jgi:8-oxo-dGTP diphosphatase
MASSPPGTGKDLLDKLEVRVVIFSLRDNALQALLARAAQSPAWELPGVPIQVDQSLEEAASQYLGHFIGLHEAYLEQLYTYGHPQRDPTQRLISVVYFAILPADAATLPSGHPQASWFSIDSLPELILDHAEIVGYALRRLRYKLEYTAVGFELLPENFSLTELQHTYELILGEKLDKRNFRRRILQAGVIEPTQQSRSSEGRPARLYRYRPDAVAEVQARRLFP